MRKIIKISPISSVFTRPVVSFTLLLGCFSVLLFFCFGLIEPILAADPIELEVSIPGRGKYVRDVADYIIAIYKLGAGIAGMVAVVVIMWGGILWLTAGGKSESIQNAKTYISSALLGLVLVFGSYMLMHSINPELVQPEVMMGRVKAKIEEHKIVGEGFTLRELKAYIKELVAKQEEYNKKYGSSETCKIGKEILPTGCLCAGNKYTTGYCCEALQKKGTENRWPWISLEKARENMGSNPNKPCGEGHVRHKQLCQNNNDNDCTGGGRESGLVCNMAYQPRNQAGQIIQDSAETDVGACLPFQREGFKCKEKNDCFLGLTCERRKCTCNCSNCRGAGLMIACNEELCDNVKNTVYPACPCVWSDRSGVAGIQRGIQGIFGASGRTGDLYAAIMGECLRADRALNVFD